MPPLALPAASYWLAMAALTYFFANLDTNPLAEVSDPSPSLPVNVPVHVPELPALSLALAPTSASPSPPPAPEPQNSEPSPETVAVAGDDAAQRDAEPARATRREALASSEPEPRAEAREQPLARNDAPAPRIEFPEFTDSSRLARRERASDGPRIAELFERREDAPDTAQPAPDKAPETTRDAPTSVSSCEAAIARNNEQISIGGARGPADVTREQYAGILQNGRYLAGCSIPDRAVFEICAAVRDGRAVGITVTSSPPSASLNACVRRAVSSLKFPVSPRLDVTHTRYDAARR
jgi:hypothetical protein